MTPPWQRFSAEELEREYSPSSCVGGNIDAFLTAYADQSRAARMRCEAAGLDVVELRYGSEPAQTVDLVVPEPGPELVPLLVFIHGGYWQALSKDESFFSAYEAAAQGLAFAAIDYTLAPLATLDEIVDECRRAVEMLRDVGPAHRIDPAKIIVCGSSAGAHLAAMVGLVSNSQWRPAAIGLISGIFELEPLIGTSINDALGLDLAAARRNSPLLAELDGAPPTLVAYGDNETAEFKRQSNELGARLAHTGVDLTLFEVPSRNHFDVILDLCDTNELLGAAISALVERVT